ncbi:MAG TPA: DUF4010 domain-containing protein [Methylophilaceae bacterium]|nr:DUF4010 domain-containing protein [Methylophilaceae bacterium]
MHSQKGTTILSLPALTGTATLLGICVALGVGLLIGAERERRKGTGPTRAVAGIRTFALASLLGAVGMLLGGSLVLAVVALVVGGLTILGYQRSRQHDPGMTTEIALVLTCLLGGLAMHEAALAAGIGTALAVLLAAKNRLHYFVSSVLTEQELHDALLFSAAVLILLPLAPNRFFGPFDAINPREIVTLVVLVMGVSAFGYIAMRSLGPRFGLPLAGLAAGFISSTATIYSMGNRAARYPNQIKGATAGAALSSVATMVQLAFVITVVEPALLKIVGLPLMLGGIAAVGYGLLFVRSAFRADADPHSELGRAFDPRAAVVFALLVSGILLVSAAVNTWLGSKGMLLSAAVTGLVDAHATAASAASLAAAGRASLEQAAWPVLMGLTTNSAVKIAAAYKAGGKAFAARIAPGIILMVVAAWAGMWI